MDELTGIGSPDGTLQAAMNLLGGLVSMPSISSTSNAAITDVCGQLLESLGFSTVRSQYEDARGLQKCNLVARRDPSRSAADATPGLAYFCHTDVVPADGWIGDGAPDASAFDPRIVDDRLYGRGACDMKGSIAAMMSAIARIDPATQRAPIWFVCTADEEVGFDGAKHLVAKCSGYRQLIDRDPVAIIGEPTELDVVYAHKGIRGFSVRSIGRAGHSATRYGINANEAMVPMLNLILEICRETRKDPRLQDSRFDPPTLSWNFGISDHTDVVNVTPERCDLWVSLRPMPDIDGADLIKRAADRAEALGLQFRTIDGCGPLLTDPESEHIRVIQSLAAAEAKTVCYCTDGGVFGELSQRVVIGPGSIEQAHTIDEWISIDQLRRGIDLYEKLLRRWCVDRPA